MQNDFTVLLGRQLNEVTDSETVLPLMAGSKTDLIGDRFHLQIRSKGIEIVADFDGNVATIFFYSGLLENYRQFSGVLPEGIGFGFSRCSVHERLGLPDASGDGMDIQFFGKSAKWDRFDRKKFSIHIEYAPDEKSIRLMSLIRTDSVPR